MKLRTAVILSCLAGFVSISMEIIWFSIVGYLIQGHAGIFGLVLSILLFGIAIGSRYINKRIKNINEQEALQLITKALLLGGIINFAGLPLMAWLITYHIAFGALILLNILAISALLGCIFPLLCHVTVSTNQQKIGEQTSWIYAANIIGATAGPLLTGYVLIDKYPMSSIISLFCIIPVLLAIFININLIKEKINRNFILAGCGIVVFVLLAHNLFYGRFLEMVHFRKEYSVAKKFEHIVENRSGIITVEKTDKGDVFYGGGAYDGAINTNPLNHSNRIERAYMVAALHPLPKKVLMIGLSTGSWAQVLADFEKIDELVIVEINNGYLELIAKYPEVAGILNNKKVKIIIDDGRRWLKMHEQEKFDLIVMNTSFHWREHITNLLSQDFLLLCKKNLQPNGVMYWNSTSSPVVLNTACHTFNYVTKYYNFVAGSDAPFSMTEAEKRTAFLAFKKNGQSILSGSDSANIQLSHFATVPLQNLKDSILQKRLRVITDNNMASEYKDRFYKR